MTVPYRIAFNIPAKGAWYGFEILTDLFFWTDVVLNFFTGYEEPRSSNFVMDFKKIRRNYIKSWFFIDVLACLPVDMVTRITEKRFLCSFTMEGCAGSGGNAAALLFKFFKVLRLVRMVKLLRLLRMGKLFERYEHEFLEAVKLIGLMKQGVILLFLGHIFGCMFYYFSTEEFRTEQEVQDILEGKYQTWIDYNFGPEPNSIDPARRYIASLYWSFTTMTTVGYGDIFAVTTSERLFAVFGMVVGGFYFSWIIGSFTGTIASMNHGARAHEEKMEAVQSFLQSVRLPKETRVGVLGFFKNQDHTSYNLPSLLSEIPFHLRRKILETMYSELLTEVKLFENLSPVLISELCCRLTPQKFLRGAMVYHRGEIGHEMFILSRGTLEVLDWKCAESELTLHRGAVFGIGVAVDDLRRVENIRAKADSHVCSVSRDKLTEVLDQYPQLRTKLVILHKWQKKRYEHNDEEYGNELTIDTTTVVDEKADGDAKTPLQFLSVLQMSLNKRRSKPVAAWGKTTAKLSQKTDEAKPNGAALLAKMGKQEESKTDGDSKQDAGTIVLQNVGEPTEDDIMMTGSDGADEGENSLLRQILAQNKEILIRLSNVEAQLDEITTLGRNATELASNAI
eukprot:gene17837-21240_t